MPRLRLRAFALFLASLAVAPTLVGAQQSVEARAHTVKKGDTLWDLARQYLGDAYLWPEIYRLNTGTIEDPHWIYPGELLTLPGKGEVTVAAQPAAQPAVSRRSAGPTIFNPDAVKRQRQTREALILRARQTAVRAGHFVASPFMWEVGGPRDGGFVSTTAEATGIQMTVAQRPIQYREKMFIKMPRGATGAKGQKFLIYRLGEVVEGQGQVVIPTGIVRTVSAPAGEDVEAEVMQKFEDVFAGQKVTELDTLQMPVNSFPARMEFGLATRVTWLYSDPVLPTTGQFLILAAGGKDGLMPGDQLSLWRDRGLDESGARRADQEVGVAQVTRVTPWGASAIVIEQKDAGIERGMAARVTAKMP